MSSSSSIAILPLILLLLFVLLPLVGLIVGIILLVRSSPGGEGMSCGQCGYSVKGLTQMNCPECGADLREVGIHKGRGGRGLGLGLVIVCSLVLLLSCGGLTFALVGDSRRSTPIVAPAQPSPPSTPARGTP